MFEVDYTDFRRIRDLIAKEGQELEKKLDGAVRQTASSANILLKRTTPRRTGFLRHGYIIRKIMNLIYVITNAVKYLVFVEEGTRPHRIEPVTAKALRFEVDNIIVFSKYVNHPGSKARNMIKEAIPIIQKDLVDNVNRVLERTLK